MWRADVHPWPDFAIMRAAPGKLLMSLRATLLHLDDSKRLIVSFEVSP